MAQRCLFLQENHKAAFPRGGQLRSRAAAGPAPPAPSRNWGLSAAQPSAGALEGQFLGWGGGFGGDGAQARGWRGAGGCLLLQGGGLSPLGGCHPPKKNIYLLKPQKQTHPNKKPRGWNELRRGWGWPSESRWGAGPQSSERNVRKPFGLLSSCFCNSRFLHGARLCEAEHAHESRNCAPKHSQNQGMGR